MSDSSSFPDFAKRHLLPFLAVFLVPCFSLWFFKHIEQDYDAKIHASIRKQVMQDTSLNPGQRQELIRQWERQPVSQLLTTQDQENEHLRAQFSDVSTSYSIFRWNLVIAWVCLVTVLVAVVMVGVCLLFAFKSNRSQYWSLRLGLPVLQTTALIEVLGQGILIGFLSYWVTAYFFERFSPKFVGIMGLAVVIMVGSILKAMFKSVDVTNEVEGEELTEAEAPHVWQRVRQMAAHLGTEPPDFIVVGIEASFYVTENPVRLAGRIETGRMLYLSLPMLKKMTVEEADCVLGHELAHFSGDDTFWSRRIAPLIRKFDAYLTALDDGLGVVVGGFLGTFWKLYQMSLGKVSRAREFRADQIGASVASPGAMVRALIKVTSYCVYRSSTEQEVIESSTVNKDLRLSEQLEQGFPKFMDRFVSSRKVVISEIPHPFDSHPTLEQRMQNLGITTLSALSDQALSAPVVLTWYNAIPRAAEMEASMWAERQGYIQDVQAEDIAWRTVPTTPEQVEQVAAHFPMRMFMNQDGSTAVLEHDQLTLPTEPQPIPLSRIESVEAQAHLDFRGSNRYTIHYRDPQGQKRKVMVVVSLFKDSQGTLEEAFDRYYSRFKLAQSRSAR
jgi:Zn-dependent protease with chaperone function